MFIFGLIMLAMLAIQFVNEGNRGTLDLSAIVLGIYILMTMFR